MARDTVSSVHPPGARPTRYAGRSSKLPAKLLLAAGMAGFTIEKVAALAGASRVTLHKWWPSKGALALDGYFSVVGPTLAFPDTGDIATDLTTHVRALVHLMRDTRAGRVVPELVGQAQTDPELSAAFRQRYSAPRRARAVAALERAKQRGQLRTDADSEVVVDHFRGACYRRLLIPDQPLTDGFAEALVANLLTGIGHP